MSPTPNINEIPKTEFWNLIKKDCNTQSELLPLADNIVRYNGQEYSNHKSEILDFLEAGVNKAKKWSDYWVTIINTLGLAYVNYQDPILHKTSLADYIHNREPLDGFYYYWALRFQFPFGRKHTEFFLNGIVVQPVICILEHLVMLLENAIIRGTDPIENAYLTYEEIILVVMKVKSNSIYAVKRNVNEIFKNRLANYDYEELKVEGYENKLELDFPYVKLYFEKFNLLKFDTANQKVHIKNWNHYYRILCFLSFRKKAYLISNHNQVVNYYSGAYNKLDPKPQKILDVVNNMSEAYQSNNHSFNVSERLVEDLSQKGFYFNPDFVESFLLSLKTKPFVILSGISGVGKSILPKMIMKLVGNDHCSPIAVAPDWTDNTDMLGYFNVDNQFVVGEFTSLILEANENPHIPFFIILDEMNLARVEYYFAQVLSVIESRYFDDELNKPQYDFLFNKGMRDRLSQMARTVGDAETRDFYQRISNLKISENVYIIGTVNVDESTQPFSKKVLDRANVLEVNEVNLMTGIFEEQIERHQPHVYLNKMFLGQITTMKELVIDWRLNEDIDIPLEETINAWVELLEEINGNLKPLKQNFGYRLRDEVCIYLYYSAFNNLDNLDDSTWWLKYFDQQLVQKILTRLSGDQGELEEVIVNLFNICSDRNEVLDQNDIINMSIAGIVEGEIRFPNAAKKLQGMLKQLVVIDRPSTSYWSV